MIIVITSTVVQGLTFQILLPDWLLETNQMENKGHVKEECEDRYVLQLSNLNKTVTILFPKTFYMQYNILFHYFKFRSGNAGSGGAEQDDSMSETEMDDVWKTVLESRSKLNDVRRRFRNCQRTYIETGSTNGTKNSSRTSSITANYQDSDDGGFDTPEQGNDSSRKEDTFSADDSDNTSEELVRVDS